mgnify:FL=1
MAANLIANYARPEAEELLKASFAQFQRRSSARAAAESIAALEGEVERMRAETVCEFGDVFEFVSLAGESPARSGRAILDLQSGDVIEEADGQRMVVLQRDRWRSSDPRVVVVGQTGRVRRVRLRDFSPGSLRLGRVDLPQPHRPKDRRFQQRVGARLKAFEPVVEEILGWTIAERVGGHPVSECPDVAEHVRLAQKVIRLEKDLRRRRARAGRGESDLLDEFDAIIDLLSDRDYVRGWSLTESGHRLRVVYSELDLLLTESIGRGVFDGLSGAEFGALASVFVYDPRGSDSAWSSPTSRFEERWRVVESTWRSLLQDEESHRLKPSRSPEPGYAETVYWWASGGSLEEVLEDEDVTAGDFVRNLRQVLDLLRQLRDGFPALEAVARDAVRAIERGVVAAGGQE